MENVNEMDLVELYYILLLNEKYGEEAPYDMSLVWNNISKFYYLYNRIYVTDKIKLELWIKEMTRYKLLDRLMSGVYEKFAYDKWPINKSDIFFLTNAKELVNIMREHTKDIDEHPKMKSLPKMNKQEVMDLVRDILESIDTNGEWLEIFNDVIHNNTVYLNELSEEKMHELEELMGIDLRDDDANACVILNEEKGYLLLTYTGTIMDVITTVHEISHYICRYKNGFKEETPILREFYANYYELYAIDYLICHGYDKEALEGIKDSRALLMKKGMEERKDLIDYFIMFINNGEIREIDDTGYDRYLRSDNAILDLIDNPYILNDYYPYVIGNYLASNAIDNSKEDKLIEPLIKHMVENISTVDPYDVFFALGCGNNNLVRVDNKKNKRKKKKKNNI